MRLGINTLFMIPGEVGGTETYLRQTLKAMAANHPDVQLVLFTNKENDPVLRMDLKARADTEFHPLGFRAMNRFSRIIREQVQLPGIVRRAGVDVLWSPGYTAPCCVGCPQVVTVHDMQYKRYPQDLTWLARVVTDVLVRLACRRCDRVIAVSGFAEREICEFTAAKSERVSVTLEGVDPVFVASGTPVRPDWLSAFVPAGKPYILGVANSYPHKNLHTLVDAFARVAGAVPHDLVLVGKARLGEPDLVAAVERSGCAARIVRIKGLPWDQIVDVYRHADVFVFPSLYEGFGLPVLEAMLADVPVVTTRCASIPEVAGEHAFFVDPVTAPLLADTMLRAIQMTPEDRQAWIAAARGWASTFTWSRTADQTVAALRMACDRP